MHKSYIYIYIYIKVESPKMMDTQNGNMCPFVVAQTKKFLDRCFYVVAQSQGNLKHPMA